MHDVPGLGLPLSLRQPPQLVRDTDNFSTRVSCQGIKNWLVTLRFTQMTDCARDELNSVDRMVFSQNFVSTLSQVVILSVITSQVGNGEQLVHILP